MSQKFSLYYAVFVASVAVMGLEVIGLGILAPNYGSSLIVQTNVIGVVLLGLAIGYRLGGVRADRGVRIENISTLLFVSAILIGLMFPFRDILVNVIGRYSGLISLGSFISSIVLFGLPSVLLGMVLPYAIKIHVENVMYSGKSSGVLYALSTAGSILGTLGIAFLVLPRAQHVGSLICVVTLLLLGTYFCNKTRVLRVVLCAGVSYVLLAYVPVPSHNFLFHKEKILLDGRIKTDVTEWKKLTDVSGVFSRIQVYDGTELESKRPIRFLIVNGGTHSGTHLDDNDLVFNYARYNRFGGHFNPAAKKALQIGGGGYTYVNYFLTDTPLYDIEKVWDLGGRKYYNNKTVTLPVLFTNNLDKRGQKRTLVYTSSSTPVGRQIEGNLNYIEVENQAPSTTVTVHRANILDTGFPDPKGYVHVHETKHDGTIGYIISDNVPFTEYPNRPRTIIGKGALISGENENVQVTLDRPAKEGEVLYAMLHRDNGNGHFDEFLVDGYEQTESIDVVEIDPRITKVAEEFFHLNRSDPRLRIFHEDARTYINRSQDKYDIIYMDAFRSFFAVPWQLATVESIQKVYGMLNENGVVVANIPASLSGEYSGFFQSALKTYQSIFPEVRVYAVRSPNEETIMQNIVFVAFKTKESIREELSDDPEINRQLVHRWYGKIDPETPLLTDDFSPTDYYTDSFAELHFF
jgi:hypothetical protein